MSSGAVASDRPMSLGQDLLENRLLLAFAAACVAVGFALAGEPLRVWTTLGDTDDAARLAQVRALLDGQGWYDLKFRQLGIPEQLVSHWSRLIDAPLVALLGLFEVFFSPRVADTIVRTIWPVGLLVAMLWLVSRETEFFGGRLAGWLVLALAAFSSYATFQFVPGRIDHHNVQIIGAAGGMIVFVAGHA